MFVLSFKNGEDDPSMNSFLKCYMPLVETKDFNALIDNKPFFHQAVKNKQEAYEKLIEMSRYDDYTTGNLLDFSYHQNYYKLIGIDLARHTNTSIPQQINFTGKLEKDDGAVMFFIAEKQQKIYSKLSFKFINCFRIIYIMEQQEILNLLNEANDSKFVTRKWNIVIDNSKSNYDATNEITYNTEILKSNLCNYNNGYILVRGDTTVVAAPGIQVAFKNCAPFAKYITKIDERTIDYAEDLDLVMPMYNLIEHSSNYFETTASLWFYSKDEATNFNADIVNDDNSNSSRYKAELL